MRKIFFLGLTAIAILPLLANAHGPARHHSHSRVQFGIGIGTGFYPGYYAGPYPGYYPGFSSGYWGGSPYSSFYYSAPIYTSPPVVIQQSPPVYIEKPPPQELAAGYWYYCASSKSYYPYVNDCPEPWQRVSPTPPSSSSSGVTP